MEYLADFLLSLSLLWRGVVLVGVTLVYCRHFIQENKWQKWRSYFQKFGIKRHQLVMGLGRSGWWLDLMMLNVFYNWDGSVTLILYTPLARAQDYFFLKLPKACWQKSCHYSFLYLPSYQSPCGEVLRQPKIEIYFQYSY